MVQNGRRRSPTNDGANRFCTLAKHLEHSLPSLASPTEPPPTQPRRSLESLSTLKHRSSSERRTQPQASEDKGTRASSQPLTDESLDQPIGLAASKVGLPKEKVTAAPVSLKKQGGRAEADDQKRRDEGEKTAEGSQEDQGAPALPSHEWTAGEDSLLLRLLAMRWGTTAFPSTFRFSWECLNCDIDTPCRRSDAEIRERCEKLIEELEGSGRGLVVQQEAGAGQTEASSSAQTLAQQQPQQQPEKKKKTKNLSKAAPRKKDRKRSSHRLSICRDFTALRVKKTRPNGSSKITVEGKGALRMRL